MFGTPAVFDASFVLDPLNGAKIALPRPRHPVPPHYRQRPRVSLACGRTVGLAIHVSTGLAIDTALDLACTLVRTTGMRVSVPVTGPADQVPDLLKAALDRSGAGPDQLELIVDAPTLQACGIEALLALSALRDDGVGIALGGGAATRTDVIPRLPLSAIILTPAVIRDIPGSAGGLAKLRDLLDAAGSHALRVVATGVSSEAQRVVLSGLGVAEGEGPIFASGTL